jgi:hypothetical protein
MEVELRKIEGNGVELEVKLKVQWSGVEVKTGGGRVELELKKFHNGVGVELK